MIFENNMGLIAAIPFCNSINLIPYRYPLFVITTGKQNIVEHI
jgi:hypothetical protein